VIAGNCEEQLAEGAGDCGCGFEEGTACDLLAKGWYPFANARVSAESRRWMAGLPKGLRFTIQGQRVLVVHGGVSVINRFLFASNRVALAQEARAAEADIVLAGHAGIPFVTQVEGCTWFNPGVIGMPANDGTPDVWYGLMTPTANGVTLSTHRLAYDAAGAAAAMRRWGYADGYARSLVTGIWPSFDVLPAAEIQAAGRRIAPQRRALVRRAERRVAADQSSAR
jgi:predicted phosphodiesterase